MKFEDVLAELDEVRKLIKQAKGAILDSRPTQASIEHLMRAYGEFRGRIGEVLHLPEVQEYLKQTHQSEASVFLGNSGAEIVIAAAHERLDQGFNILSGLQQPPMSTHPERDLKGQIALGEKELEEVVQDLALTLTGRKIKFITPSWTDQQTHKNEKGN